MKKMNAFERLKRLRDDKFSLRVRMTCMVSAEILVCIILSYFISSFFNNRFHIKVPIILELLVLSLFIGLLVTGLMSKWFFAPVKKLRSAMERLRTGIFRSGLKRDPHQRRYGRYFQVLTL